MRITKVLGIRIFGVVIFCILMLDVIFLTLENRELKTALDAVAQRDESPQLPGMVIPTFGALTLGRNAVTLNLADSGKHYLLFLLSADCHACESTLGSWNSFKTEGNVEILGVSLSNYEETVRYVGSNSVEFDVLTLSDPNFIPTIKIRSIPLTILINPRGVVVKSWG